MDIEKTNLREIGGGPITLDETGNFDLIELKKFLWGEAHEKRNLIINIKYVEERASYGFAVYDNSKEDENYLIGQPTLTTKEENIFAEFSKVLNE